MFSDGKRSQLALSKYLLLAYCTTIRIAVTEIGGVSVPAVRPT